MLYSKFYNKNISVWQHLGFILSEIMVLSTIFILVLQSIDIHMNMFHYGTFMFDYLDLYSKIHCLTIFDFGIMISSMIPECIAFNIIVTITSVLLCIALGCFSFRIYKPKAKTALIVWMIILIIESLFSLVFILSHWFFVLIFIAKAFFLFCLIMSFKHINNHYDYYDV